MGSPRSEEDEEEVEEDVHVVDLPFISNRGSGMKSSRLTGTTDAKTRISDRNKSTQDKRADVKVVGVPPILPGISRR
jgi:hypothetical protein